MFRENFEKNVANKKWTLIPGLLEWFERKVRDAYPPNAAEILNILQDMKYYYQNNVFALVHTYVMYLAGKPKIPYPPIYKKFENSLLNYQDASDLRNLFEQIRKPETFEEVYFFLFIRNRLDNLDFFKKHFDGRRDRIKSISSRDFYSEDLHNMNIRGVKELGSILYDLYDTKDFYQFVHQKMSELMKMISDYEIRGYQLQLRQQYG